MVNINHIRIFGSTAYAHIPKQNRQKLDVKSNKYVFVGYENNSKAYRLLNLSNDKIVISRDVKFIENHNDGYSKSKTDVNQDVNNIEEVDINISEKQMKNNTSLNENIDQNINKTELDLVNEDEQDIYNENENGNEQTKNVRKSKRINKGVTSKYEIYDTNNKIDRKFVMKNRFEPKTFQEAIECENSEKWINAMNDELTSLNNNNTWQIVPLPNGKTIVGSKWIFKIKYNADESIMKYKARVVAQGFSQKYGQDYDEVFAPVVKPTTIRILLNIASKENMEVIHYDFKTAFLNATLNEEIYMKPPDGMKNEVTNGVCKLNKSIYGLKQAAKLWNNTIDDLLKQLGFKAGEMDSCLYYKDEKEKMYVLVYVDDILIACKNLDLIKEVEHEIKTRYNIDCLGNIKYYLGIEIIKDYKGIYHLHQKSYIMKILKLYNMETAKSSRIPMDVNYFKNETIENKVAFENPEIYRSAIGKLLYLSVHSRPDISVATIILARKVSNPTKGDWTELKRILKYLRGTIDYTIKLGDIKMEKNILYGFSDADWANDTQNRKSNTGYLFIFNGGIIQWRSKKQDTVALSSTDAELIALTSTTAEAIYLKDLIMNDFKIEIKGITIYEDNQPCLKWVETGQITDRSKYIGVKIKFIHEIKENKTVSFEYCNTNNMIADFLTKPINGEKLETFLKKLQIDKFKY